MMLLFVLLSLTFEISENNKDRAIDKVIDKIVSEHFVSELVSNYRIPIININLFPKILESNKGRVFSVAKSKSGWSVDFLADEYNKIIKSGKMDVKILNLPVGIALDTTKLILKPKIDIVSKSDSLLTIKNIGTYTALDVSILLDDIEIKKLNYLKPDSSIDIAIDPWFSHELKVYSEKYERKFEIPAQVPIEFYPSIKTPFSDVLGGDRIVTSIEIVNLKDSILKSVIVEEKSIYDGKPISKPKKFTIDLDPKADTVLALNDFVVPPETKSLRISFKILYNGFVKNLDYTIDVKPYYELFDEEKPSRTNIKRTAIGICYGYDDPQTLSYFKRDAFIISRYFRDILGCKEKLIKEKAEFLKTLHENKNRTVLIFFAGLGRKEKNRIMVGDLEMNSIFQNLKNLQADTIIIFFDIPYKGDKKVFEKFSLPKIGKNFAYFLVSYPFDEWKFDNRHGLLTSLLIKYLNDKNIHNLTDLKSAIEKKIGSRAEMKINNLNKFIVRR